MKEKLKLHWCYIAIIISISIIYTYYISISSIDVPFMDYWRMILRTENLINENMNLFNIMWSSDFGQRNPLIYFCIYMNLKYFNLNCELSSYLALIPMILSCTIIYKVWFNSIMKINNNPKIMKFLSLAFVLCIFNLNQWEILSIQFAFSFMLRITVYLLIFYLIDKSLHTDKGVNNRYFYLSIIMTIIATIGLSQLYFAGLILSIWLVLFFHCFFMKKKNRKNFIKYMLLWMFFSFFGVVIYFWGNSMVSSGGSGINFFVKSVFDGELIKAFMGMLAAIILPQTAIQKIGNSLTYAVGMLIFLLILICIYLYIKEKMYEQSYLPILMILYGMISMASIAYGRLGIFSAEYLRASRYVVETSLILAGVMYILTLKLCVDKASAKYRLGVGLIIISIMLCLLVSLKSEIDVGYYRNEYKKGISKLLYDVENVEDDKLNGFQADVSYIRELTPILKEKNLSLFK